MLMDDADTRDKSIPPKIPRDPDTKSKTDHNGNEELINWAASNLKGIPKNNIQYRRMVSSVPYICWDVELDWERHIRHQKARDFYKLDLPLEFEHEGKMIKLSEKYAEKDHDYHQISIKKLAEKRHEYLSGIFGHIGESIFIEPPFYVDYGMNTHIGEGFYSNFNMTILDTSVVKIGKYVEFGPNVVLTCPSHDLDPLGRSHDLIEFALPITIGDYVWLGASVTVLGGVTVGEGVVVGANSVVTKDLPAYTVCVGVPAKPIKLIYGYEHKADPAVVALLNKTKNNVTQSDVAAAEAEELKAKVGRKSALS